MKKILFLLLFIVSFSAQSQWSLYWHDEFESTVLDSTKWTREIGGNGWGNNEFQYYTGTTNNSQLVNGQLVITAKKEPFGQNQYTSARLITKNKFDFRYGRIEARIKVPMGQGLWPAFWMLGSNISAVSWPKCGEIDVMEHINNEAKIYGTYHFDSIGHRYHGDEIGCNPAEYHQYALVWNNQEMIWLLDNVPYYQATITNGNGNKEEFHLPFFILLNLAVGGNWPGPPLLSTPFPSQMLVDYVRVYVDQSVIGISENEMKLLDFSPNPATNSLQIAIKNNNYPTKATCYSLEGNSFELPVEGNILNTASIANGHYSLVVTFEDGNVQRNSFIKLGN
jgi:beta-glucanase (GH16 family)